VSEITKEAAIRKAGQVAIDDLIDRAICDVGSDDEIADYLTRIVDACVSAALSRPEAIGEPEPVAYLITTVRTGETRISTRPVANLPYNRDRFTSQPLYTSPPPSEGEKRMREQNEWLKDRLADLQLPARSQKNIEEWLVECGMPALSDQRGGNGEGRETTAETWGEWERKQQEADR
jgi:hypothetical protein